jgi:hypothetical protein
VRITVGSCDIHNGIKTVGWAGYLDLREALLQYLQKFMRPHIYQGLPKKVIPEGEAFPGGEAAVQVLYMGQILFIPAQEVK